VEGRLGEKSPEERRMERLLRRTAREIYKLRKTRTNKGQLDVQSFRYGIE
jgi:protein KIBRA